MAGIGLKVIVGDKNEQRRKRSQSKIMLMQNIIAENVML